MAAAVIQRCYRKYKQVCVCCARVGGVSVSVLTDLLSLSLVANMDSSEGKNQRCSDVLPLCVFVFRS